MGRSPSHSSDSSDPENHARVESHLLKAIEEKKHKDIVAIVEHAQAKSQPVDHLLRIGLMRAAEQGNIDIAEYLLKSGAKPDGATGGRVLPLFEAIERNHVSIVQLLLKFGGNVDAQDKQGRTALMTAAWKGYFHIVVELLRRGADVNKKDHSGRNVLHNLAADKRCNWGQDIIAELLRSDIALDGPNSYDDSKRSPLHWAASTGKKELCEMLLRRQWTPKANVNAVEIRQKTALHLAVAHDDITKLLLDYGANVTAKSDGGWTPLHNACEQGSVKVIRTLLTAGADINAKLLNGMTPLHVATLAGHLEVVDCLLERKDIKRAVRDTFGIAPFLRAAQSKKPARKHIMNRLAPSNQECSLTRDALGATKGFHATIVDFGHNSNKVSKKTVYELLYSRDTVNPMKPATTILPNDSKATSFRWIHLPANNIAWVEALLTKAFIEEGASNVEGFKALERSLSHQHRGKQIHSHFMRPLCQSMHYASKRQEEFDHSDSDEKGPPQCVVSGGLGLSIDTTAGAEEAAPSAPFSRKSVRTGTVSTDQSDWISDSSINLTGKEGKGQTKDNTKKLQKWSGSKHARKRESGTDIPTGRTDRHSRRPPMSSSLFNSGHIFAFMPYLHFETDRRRQEMQAGIVLAKRLKDSDRHEGQITNPVVRQASTYDEMLLRAYLTNSQVSLHIRRTLDQFFYNNIDTQSRDYDQVVYRYQCKSSNNGDVDPKIFMVDQLWMWTLGKDLIVTAFPQRWQQPRNDPLNVLDGIIEEINSKTRDLVRNVYDLAMMITSRCSGLFDRHRVGDEDYQFLDMFESSIGDATEMETMLFKEFHIASTAASAWLHHHQRPNHNDNSSHAHAPLFIDKLLDIGSETDLLAEIKDIRDELNMIAKVLQDQRNILPDLETSITDIYSEEYKCQHDLKKRFRDMSRNIDTPIRDLERMDIQAERIYKSITDLLDLKQKRANAFGARFAREQAAEAAGTARQSRTVMVFTIVTIIFLPLSFIATLFTINIEEFPRRPGGDEPSLPMKYVFKYMFGIGLAISIPFIAIALSFDAIGNFFREVRRRLSDRPQPQHENTNKRTISDEEMDVEYTVDTVALEQALSVGRSTMRLDSRRSIEGNFNRGLRRSTTLSLRANRSTMRSGSKRNLHVDSDTA